MATPATGALMGMPASMRERQPPHTAAMEEEPLDSTVSETTRTVKGKSASAGMTGRRDFSARAPWPISRRETRTGFTSPTLKGGKL